MKKIFLFFTSFFIALLLFKQNTYAIYNPFSVKNNIFGIHILFSTEVSEASSLVNSNGGDWGYVTIPIMASDRDLAKWQKFMDECRKYHIIPIVRIATNGDYFSKSSWSKPTDYDILDFANFLNNLSWPTKNRYVIIFNEPNRGDEWGGSPDSSEYAQILDYAVMIFKERNPSFFIISAGLDNASANILGQSINYSSFMYGMDNSVPGIFSEIDGLGSHSYPNPAFSSPPSYSREGIYSFYYQNLLAKELSGKNLPVFITETGWSSNNVTLDKQSNYLRDAFGDYWNNPNIVAVTPFIFHAEDGPFTQFSFIKNNDKTEIYTAYKNFPKTKGEPLLTQKTVDSGDLNLILPTKKFDKNNPMNSVFEKIDKSTKNFFKWLLGF